MSLHVLRKLKKIIYFKILKISKTQKRMFQDIVERQVFIQFCVNPFDGFWQNTLYGGTLDADGSSDDTV